jgi:hypothetical protein
MTSHSHGRFHKRFWNAKARVRRIIPRFVFIEHRERRLIRAEFFPDDVFRGELVRQRAPRTFLPRAKIRRKCDLLGLLFSLPTLRSCCDFK